MAISLHNLDNRNSFRHITLSTVDYIKLTIKIIYEEWLKFDQWYKVSQKK